MLLQLHGRLASLSPAVDSWVVELLLESVSDSRRLGLPQVSPMFSRLADTVEEDRDDREELRAFRKAMSRLHDEWPAEHGEVARITSTGAEARATTPFDRSLAIDGLLRVAQWVDAALED